MTVRYSVTVFNSEIDEGGASQNVLAENLLRNFFEIQNHSSEDLWINFGNNAAVDTGIKIVSGGSYCTQPHFCPTNLITIFGATGGSKFVALEG